ncbi:MAG: hypothetical protein E6K68_01335 [Nitrospirae bacterium]|nr:MAG: hypothetical protein E6K68_01335 [Nitrospirota bacterium]
MEGNVMRWIKGILLALTLLLWGYIGIEMTATKLDWLQAGLGAILAYFILQLYILESKVDTLLERKVAK